MNGFRLFLVSAGLAICLVGSARAESDAKAKGWEILTAAREAAGTAKAELRDYSCSLETSISRENGPRIELKSELQLIMPGIIRQEVQTPAGLMTLTFDGERGARHVNGEATEMPTERADQIRADLARSNVLLGAAPSAEAVRFLRREKVEDREADLIEVQDVAGAPVRLYIDVESRDLLKMVYVGDLPGGGMGQVEEIFSDYMDAGGFRLYGMRRVIRNGKEAMVTKQADCLVNKGLKSEVLLR